MIDGDNIWSQFNSPKGLFDDILKNGGSTTSTAFGHNTLSLNQVLDQMKKMLEGARDRAEIANMMGADAKKIERQMRRLK